MTTPSGHWWEGVTCTSRAVWPPPVDCEAPRSSHRESPGHEPGVKPRTTRRVVHAIPFNSESGREPGVSAAGAPGRHRQAHRGLPQGRLAGSDRRTRHDHDRRARPHRRGKLTVTDGPFTEAKEVVGGYAVLEAKSRDEALAAARTFLRLHQQHWPGWEGECEDRKSTRLISSHVAISYA